ncbi:MAG TPA: endo-1,3-alpha-glucanase family glycosylhydrolase [Terriglobales bacterium]|nr:endo-1,3-alpha-glucanase family glycosylhydrolase [Terriglobales bacterium]
MNVGYSSQDPVTLRRQIEKAESMGISGFVVNWYGDRQPYLDRSYALLQQLATETPFKVALMYDESDGDQAQATDDAIAAFDKAYKSYVGPDAAARTAYLTYQGRPVIFVFPKGGHTDWNRIRQHANSWAVPPLLLYKDEPPANESSAFDGEYAWVHPSGSQWSPDGSDWGADYLEAFYKRMLNRHPDKIAVGAAWPGFDDRSAPWSLNRYIDPRCGRTFEDSFRLFRRYYDRSHPLPFLLIATWNDYEEGTAIERGIATCTSGPRNSSAWRANP